MKTVKIILAFVVVIMLINWLLPSSYEIRNANPVSEAIICFGDSLTYGTGARDGMDYPAQLSRLIGRPIINAGVPGDTTASALDRIDSVIVQDPGIVLITLGGNDLKNGISKETAFNNLKLIVSQLQDNGTLVVIGGIDIPFLGRGFDDGYEILARETGAILVPNVMHGIFGKAGLMSDQIHPNTEGYTIMTQYFHTALQPFL
jgi:lysophospholipase L1-like esterase